RTWRSSDTLSPSTGRRSPGTGPWSRTCSRREDRRTASDLPHEVPSCIADTGCGGAAPNRWCRPAWAGARSHRAWGHRPWPPAWTWRGLRLGAIRVPLEEPVEVVGHRGTADVLHHLVIGEPVLLGVVHQEQLHVQVLSLAQCVHHPGAGAPVEVQHHEEP